VGVHPNRDQLRYGQAFQRETPYESLTGNRVSTGIAAHRVGGVTACRRNVVRTLWAAALREAVGLVVIPLGVQTVYSARQAT
jgi:hypothetical protein